MTDATTMNPYRDKPGCYEGSCFRRGLAQGKTHQAKKVAVLRSLVGHCDQTLQLLERHVPSVSVMRELIQEVLDETKDD